MRIGNERIIGYNPIVCKDNLIRTLYNFSHLPKIDINNLDTSGAFDFSCIPFKINITKNNASAVKRKINTNLKDLDPLAKRYCFSSITIDKVNIFIFNIWGHAEPIQTYKISFAMPKKIYLQELLSMDLSRFIELSKHTHINIIPRILRSGSLSGLHTYNDAIELSELLINQLKLKTLDDLCKITVDDLLKTNISQNNIERLLLTLFDLGITLNGKTKYENKQRTIIFPDPKEPKPYPITF